MAGRRAFWVIVQGSTPTAFRARRAEDLLPTLHQLQRTQPDTFLRWFDRGRFWESPEAERESYLAARRTATSRNRDWRPGGDHADPRARFKIPRDQKRARFKARQRRDWDRGEKPERQEPGTENRSPRTESRPKWRDERRPKWGNTERREPQGDRPGPRGEQRPKWGNSGRRGPGGENRGGKRPWKPKPGGSRPPRGPGSSRPPGRAHFRGPRRPKGPRGPKRGS